MVDKKVRVSSSFEKSLCLTHKLRLLTNYVDSFFVLFYMEKYFCIAGPENSIIEDLKKNINYYRKEHGKKEFDINYSYNPNLSNIDSCDNELIKLVDENQIIYSVEAKEGYSI